VEENLNPGLSIGSVVLTMFDGRTRLAQQVVDEVRSFFGARACATIIPRTVRLSEAPSYAQPITLFDPEGRGADAYRGLAAEVATGLGLERFSMEKALQAAAAAVARAAQQAAAEQQRGDA
jgi:chromosome partitioning protein